MASRKSESDFFFSSHFLLGSCLSESGTFPYRVWGRMTSSILLCPQRLKSIRARLNCRIVMSGGQNLNCKKCFSVDPTVNKWFFINIHIALMPKKWRKKLKNIDFKVKCWISLRLSKSCTYVFKKGKVSYSRTDVGDLLRNQSVIQKNTKNTSFRAVHIHKCISYEIYIF